MSHAEVFRADLPEESLLARWWDVLISGLLFGVGWVLLEFLAAPAIGVTVASIKFGWNDFLTAVWLQKRDPHRGRAAACFWFFVAQGLWKITVMAFLLAVIIAVVANHQGQPKRPAMKLAVSSSLLMFSGLALLTIVPVIGAMRARQCGVKVYVNGSLHAYRKRNLWPVWPTGRNNARGLLLAALILPLLVAAVLVRFRIRPIVVTGLLAQGAFLWWLARGAIARTAAEAWDSAWLDPPAVEPVDAQLPEPEAIGGR